MAYINEEICNKLLENTFNSLENSKNDAYKKDLYHHKLLKQLLIELNTSASGSSASGGNIKVYKDIYNKPCVKLITDELHLQCISDRLWKYVCNNNVNDIVALLESKKFLKDFEKALDLKIDSNTKLFNIYYGDGTPISNTNAYGEQWKLLNKVVENIYLNAQLESLEVTTSIYERIRDMYQSGTLVISERDTKECIDIIYKTMVNLNGGYGTTKPFYI